MWVRNLLFAVLMGSGVVAFTVSLVPSLKASRDQHPTYSPLWDDDFAAAVNRLDRAFGEQWQKQNLEPADRASDLLIARRLSLALTGTVPSLEEIRNFESRPPAERIPGWITGILNDERSSDYLGERLARAYVGTQDGPFLIYRRRRFVTWLADKLHNNVPYDELVRDLIASDGLWTNEPAANFITATVKSDQDKGPDAAALAARVSRAFLGIRLDCAECHDHPFDPWTQDQFRGLAAFFGKTEQTITGIREGKGDFKVEDRQSGETLTIEPSVPFQPELLSEHRNARRRLAAWVTHAENKAFAQATVNRLWALMFGRALVEPVDNIRSNETHPEALSLLAEDFIEHRYNLKRLIAVIGSSRAFQLDSQAPTDELGEPLPGHELTEAHELAWAAFPLSRLRPEQVSGGVLQTSTLATIDYDSHIIIKLVRAASQTEFVERYGDAGEEELDPHGGTIPQRLLMMNGGLVKDRSESGNISTAATRIAWLAPNDAQAIETAYLAVLTRRPTPVEAEHFAARLRDIRGNRRGQELEDLFWELINATEFSWNH